MTSIAVGAPRVAAVRSFLRSRRRRRWFDWYTAGFTAILGIVLLSDVLADPFRRLTAAPGTSAPAQAVAGAALVIGAASGVVALAQALGPLALSPADASWLLLSPLDRRGVLRQPMATAAALAALAGGVLGALALAMAGPYLRHGGHGVPWPALVLAAVDGAGFVLAAMLVAVLVQPSEHRRSQLRTACAVVSAVAAAVAVTGEHWTALSRAITTGFADLSAGTAGPATAGAVTAAAGVAAVGLALLVWRALPRFPAGVLRSGSARAGRVVLAATFGNVALLTWIAEDSHWRGRLLRSRCWPRLPPAWALAWADWRRLARRPAVLAVLAGSALVPALAGAAVAGRARGGLVTAAALLAGAIAAGVQGTAATRRDTNDPALSRLLGVRPEAAVTARAALPALLSAAWLTLALVLLVFGGVLSGWWWPLLGPAAGPGVAAAALRIARTAPIDPREPVPDTPVSAPPWLVTRAISVLLGAAGAYPALKAVRAGQLHGSTFELQVVVSGVVLGGYLLLAASSGRGAGGGRT